MNGLSSFDLCKLPVNETAKDHAKWVPYILVNKIIEDHPTVVENKASEIILVKDIPFSGVNGGILSNGSSDW